MKRDLVYEKLRTMLDWLSDVYDLQVKEYSRCVRLGIEYDNKYGTIEELDKKAEQYVEEIRKIKAGDIKNGN
jgi:hypothetical protein